MKYKITAIAILLSFSFTVKVIAQSNQTKAVLTADSLASGNYKDVITSFFQLAFDNLTGKNKELKFNSNPYAIMMRADKELESYNNYKKNRVLRNLNFSFNLKLDTNYHFNGFSSGVSYALINKRDYTVYDEFIDLALLKSSDFHILSKGISTELSAITNTEKKNKIRAQIFDKLFNDTSFKFSQLDAEAKELVQKVIKKDGLTSLDSLLKKNAQVSFAKVVNDGYEEVKSSFQKRPLLTLSLSDTTYKDEFMFSNIVVKLEYLQGLSKSKKGANWEFNIPASLNFLNDTIQAGRDLKRAVFQIEPGINLVMRNNDLNHSFFEMKFSGEYRHIFNTPYVNEKKSEFTFNGTLRIRVANDIWIPLKFKYDPKNGNVFGFLSVKFNFSGQGKN